MDDVLPDGIDERVIHKAAEDARTCLQHWMFLRQEKDRTLDFAKWDVKILIPHHLNGPSDMVVVIESPATRPGHVFTRSKLFDCLPIPSGRYADFLSDLNAIVFRLADSAQKKHQQLMAEHGWDGNRWRPSELGNVVAS